MKTPTTPPPLNIPSKMFSSSASIDITQLCFNTTHFNRPEFNVELFMHLSRKRATLKELHNDLRVYLKSVQNSMIELINDDYADFVHLSSNLVALKANIDKIETDLQSTWTEFENITRQSVEMAEIIDKKSQELLLNRSEQIRLRDKIAFIQAVQKISATLANVPSPMHAAWLEVLSTAVVDASTFHKHVIEGSKEEAAYKQVIAKCQAVLGDQAVVLLNASNINAEVLAAVLSILHLCGCTDQLVSKVVSSVFVPRVSVKGKKSREALTSAVAIVLEARADWRTKFGSAWSQNIEFFLDSCILTFLLTFLEEHLITTICPTLPRDTDEFPHCFMTISNLIQTWPTASKHVVLLQQLGQKFQTYIYYTSIANKLVNEYTEAMKPECFAFLSEPERTLDDGDTLNCSSSLLILNAVKKVWSPNVFVFPLTDKFWEFTVNALVRHKEWADTISNHILNQPEEFCGVPKWMAVLRVRHDIQVVDEKVFDLALEIIFDKVKQLGLETTAFGECLSKHSLAVKSLCKNIEILAADVIRNAVFKEFDNVAEVPRQYRWTKKPAPTKYSAYIDAAHKSIESLEAESKSDRLEHCLAAVDAIHINGYDHFVDKASQILESVAATGTSISRLKRREGSAIEGDTDESKIRLQIYLDAEECRRRAQLRGLLTEKLDSLVSQLVDVTKDSTA